MAVIIVKTPKEIEAMRVAGRITAQSRSLAMSMVKAGITTKEIDREVHHIHGIPGKRVIHEGDIVSVDLGACIGGYHGDCAATVPCGQVSDEAQRLIDVTRQSFFEGIKFARQGYRVSDVSHAIQEYVESHGFSLVREYVGHGVGASLHEAPEVPNYGQPGHGPRLIRGMTLAVEPMVNAGGAGIRVLEDNWTVVTQDGKYSAHYENTILITDGEPEILTFSEDM